MRERFGLRVSPERRKAVLIEADKTLAKWSLGLPESLRTPVNSSLDCWRAMLQLVYNNFLILLHRPHPRASSYSDDYGPHDAEICSAAAGVIVSTFEDLRERDQIKYLWVSSVNAIFTAIIQVRIELRFSNPVLAINGLRRFNSTMESLRLLAKYWIHARTIRQLFLSSKRLQHDLQVARMNDPSLNTPNSVLRPANEIALNDRDHVPPPITTHTVAADNNSSTPESTYDPLPSATVLEPSPLQQDAQSIQRSDYLIFNQLSPKVKPETPSSHPLPQISNMDFGLRPFAPETPQEQSNTTAPDGIEIKVPNASPPTGCGSSPLDWRQLFHLADLGSADGNSGSGIHMNPILSVDNLGDFEDEWRNLYLHDPSMPDFLRQDGTWMYDDLGER